MPLKKGSSKKVISANIRRETLAMIAKTGESEAARVSASVAILDRAYGRPGQAVEITDERVTMPRAIRIVPG